MARTVVIDASDADVDAVPARYLDAARNKKVLFNHQSVGANLLAGLDTLAGSAPGRYGLNRAGDPEPSWYDDQANGVGDFTRGSNGDPRSKIDGFDGLLRRSGYGPRVQVGLMKFCYVDMGVLEPSELWDRYRTRMQALQHDYPKVTFVWTTVPLTSGDNSEQAAFNGAVRRYVQVNGGFLLDLAALESTPPTTISGVGQSGEPRLDAAYDSGDGGHLNDVGQRRLASAWWQLMARVAGWDGTSK